MAALSPARTPAGVVSLARPRASSVNDLLTPSPALVVVAVDVQDPGNVGAIVRSAEAGGATGVLFTGASADPWGWKALRAAMGSTFRMPVRREPDTRVALDRLREAGLCAIAAVPRGAEPMHRVDLRRAVALVFGGRAAGSNRRSSMPLTERISIPMSMAVDSLNVAVAAAVLIYEVRRQRTSQSS